MVVFKSKLPNTEFPLIGTFQCLLSNTRQTPGDKVIFIDGTTDEKLTFSELNSNSRKFAAGLQDKVDFKRGNILSIFSPNRVDYAVIMFGTIAAGGIVTPANPNYTVDEFAFQLKDSGASVIVVHPNYLSTAIKAAASANIPDSKIFVFGNESIDGILPYSSLFSEREAIPIEFTSEEIKTTTVFLCYSSGTTGKQKGVETTHQNVASALGRSTENARSKVVLLGMMPFFHIYGLLLLMHVTAVGASCAIIPKFDIRTLCRVIQDYKVSVANLVPPVILALVNSPIPKEYDLSSLQMVISGAAPLSKELCESFNNAYKIKIRQGYGLTETMSTHFDTSENTAPGSIGTLLPNIECKLISEDGQEVGYNEPGELCVRGPNIMKGYLNNKEAINATMDEDGFFHTGDIATVDENGNFYIVDRIKELIKYKGYQVAPAELEAILLTHPSISDAAVIGIYSEQEATEHPVAYVVLQSNIQPTEKLSQEIKNFVHDKVAPHKRLRGGIFYTEQIPRNATGKILRRILKDKHLNAKN